MEEKYSVMLSLIKCLIQNEESCSRTRTFAENELASLYKISKKHELAHLIGYALEKYKLFGNSSLQTLFTEQILISQYLYERQRYVFDEICTCLENKKIDHLPLKGTVIRLLYPEPWMRTCSDIDILVRYEDFETAYNVISDKLGYTLEKISSHEALISSDDGVRIELHYVLLEDKRAVDSSKVLKNVWKYSKPSNSNSFLYVMEDEMFYFYHIAHMAKHFEEGGCGVRSVLDLWIMQEHGVGIGEKTKKLIADAGLMQFEDAICKTACIWFGYEKDNGDIDDIQEFILNGGTYGNTESRYTLYKHRAGGGFRYVLKRMFLPIDQLKYQYPILQKNVLLYPFCTIHRWCSMLFGSKSKKRKEAIDAVENVSDENVEAVAALLKKLKLE